MAGYSFFGEGLPGIDLAELKGKLIVLEGTDGVGRSTHIGLLRQWLENHGHAGAALSPACVGADRWSESFR